MTTSRLFPAASGPTLTPYTSTPFTAGVGFRCIGPSIQWLQGFYVWIPAGGDTAPAGGYKTQLWQGLSATSGIQIGGTAVTSTGPFTAAEWNYIPLAAPVPLALDTPWIAGVGWTPSEGFSDTSNQFGSGDPFSAGFTSGDLFAYSDVTGTAFSPAGTAQGGFSTAASPPQLPDQGSASANFWVDVLVSDTAPAGYTGPFSLYPSNTNGNLSVTLDEGVNYNVGTEIAFSVPVLVSAVRYLSPSGAASLATRAAIWSITGGGLGGAELAAITAPSWSGAAGSGWVQADFASPVLFPAGKYRVTVYNSNGTSGGWNAKDSETGAFATGNYQFGISNGPLSAPNQASASLCYDYNGADAGNVPPYNGGTTESGQCPFGQLPSGLNATPYLYAGLASGSTPQNYFTDVLASIAPATTAAPRLPRDEPMVLRLIGGAR